MKQIQYRLQVELLSEAIFSSGEKEANLVQSKVLSDADGFVYFHAKSLKGLLKKRAIWLLKHYAKLDEERARQFLLSIITLFGINREELDLLSTECERLVGSHSVLIQEIDKQKKGHKPAGILKLGHLELPAAVRNYYKMLYQSQFAAADDKDVYVFLSKHNLIEAQTHVRIGIQLENGVVKDNMFNSMHSVRKGLVFNASLSLEKEASQLIIADLSRIVCALDRIGAAYHRGYGEVRTKLIYKLDDVGHQRKGGQ